MKIHELNHVAIHVADVARSSAFYRDVLRLESLPRPVNANNHFALRVDDIAAWEKQLQQVGAEFRPRKQRPDGAWQIFLRDPDGHYIELFTF